GDRVTRGDNEHREREPALALRLQQRESVAPRQAQIEQHELEGFAAQDRLRRPRLAHPVDGEAIAPQSRADGLPDHRVILDQEQSHRRQSMIDRRAPRPRSPDLSSAERLTRAAATLGVPLSPEGAQQLLRLTSELALWNRSYNLTAITDPQEMLTPHLLDSLPLPPHP